MTESKQQTARYRVLVGINWPDGKGGEKRAEAGEIITAAALRTSKGGARGFVQLGAIEEIEGGS